MSLIKSACALLCGASLPLLLAGNPYAADYQHSLAVDQMTFAWSVAGDNLAVKVSAPTIGWVAVGFNPTDIMKDANIVIGYVKDGKVEISDDVGTQPTQHSPDTKREGTDNVTVVGGSETGNTTTLEFSIPLKSGDPNDGVIDPNADTKVMLAYGPDRDSTKLKHQFAKTVTINLASGAMK
ncbi:DOMON domain-containing protein [Desulfobulbus elongatus]|uniref:DOMON domain-containing protein n=1 Tax=Desulfobulbus elongatus TaxID=53332 RepID=UPI0006842B97|nr:DOMON domain-containing protein [Desulfobulbus elongatus]